MLAAIRNRLNYGNVVAVLALFFAFSGGAWALSKNSVGSRQIVNDSVKSKDLKDEGAKYKDLRDVVRIKATLDFGQSKTLLEHGSLTLTAQCLLNTTDNFGTPGQDVARVLIATSKDGAVFEGDDLKDGTDAADFLDVGTPEADRVFNEGNAATGTGAFSTGDSDGGAYDPDGKGILLPEDQSAASLNLLGSDCRFWGAAHLVR